MPGSLLGILSVLKPLREQEAAEAAFALMASHGVVPIPENFRLFFEYAASDNPPLRLAVDAALASGAPFTPHLLARLRQHIVNDSRAIEDLDTLSKDVSAALDSVLVTLETAGKDALSYGQTLSGAIEEMVSDQSPLTMRRLVDGLMGATQAMEARARILEDELQRSSIEVSDLKTKLDDVRKESLTDPLTGIPNRKSFDTALANAVHDANETGEEFALCMCDIDHFKSFNDSWGHQIGDQVLRLVGGCLSENVKGRDTAARYGGEEFAIILRQARLEHALGLASQIRKHVESKKLVKKSTGDSLGAITISLGVAQFRPGETAADLLQRADACLYAAKRAGRNCVIGEEDRKSGWPAA